MKESVKFENGKLKWRSDMPAEERRVDNAKNWQDFRDFMTRSDTYRENDKVTQKNILDEAKKTNGRISDLEDWRREIETKIKDKKDNTTNIQALITIIATLVMAVSALVMIFKK